MFEFFLYYQLMGKGENVCPFLACIICSDFPFRSGDFMFRFCTGTVIRLAMGIPPLMFRVYILLRFSISSSKTFASADLDKVFKT